MAPAVLTADRSCCTSGPSGTETSAPVGPEEHAAATAMIERPARARPRRARIGSEITVISPYNRSRDQRTATGSARYGVGVMAHACCGPAAPQADDTRIWKVHELRTRTR